MKPKNFPARKLKRQLIAKGEKLEDHEGELIAARAIRTKKDRSNARRTLTENSKPW